MSASDPNAQLQQAIALAQAGQLDDARARLEAIVAADPSQEVAWMWLATVAPTQAERIRYLERALALNPTNSTTRQAYEQLTGRAWAAPDAAPASPDAAGAGADTDGPAWLRSVRQEVPLSPANIVAIMLVGAFAVVALVVALNQINNDDGGDTPAQFPTLTPPPLFLSPSPTRLVFTPTPSDTPLPTITEGPSPTPVWDNPPPTWTPVPSLTAPPTRTPAPSSTPLPSITPIPSQPPPSETFTPLPPTATPTASLTPDATASPRPTRTPRPDDAPDESDRESDSDNGVDDDAERGDDANGDDSAPDDAAPPASNGSQAASARL